VRLAIHDREPVSLLPGKPRLSTGRAVACILLSLPAVFWLDRTTGVAPVQHLYYAPIIVSAVVFGRWGGLLTALAAAVLYHMANPGPVSLALEERDVVQVALFVAVGLVTAKLTTDGRKMRTLAMTDDLTGLHNLRSFESRLPQMFDEACAAKASLSLLALDVDRLKSLNDRHGHLVGAEAVRAVGRTIAVSIPAGAVACRYGGDEFVVALPLCGEAEALRIARRIQESVNTLAPVLAGRPFPSGSLSVSVGVACRKFEAQSGPAGPAVNEGEAMFRAADAALYAAKDGGRNRVMLGAALAPQLSAKSPALQRPTRAAP
jgi:diguanylate cyclase (GGDEF)-like protein